MLWDVHAGTIEYFDFTRSSSCNERQDEYMLYVRVTPSVEWRRVSNPHKGVHQGLAQSKTQVLRKYLS